MGDDPLGFNPKHEIEMSVSSKAKVERSKTGHHQMEWRGLTLTRISAALDVKAIELVFSGSILSLPALLPSHLRPAEELGLPLLPSTFKEPKMTNS